MFCCLGAGKPFPQASPPIHSFRNRIGLSFRAHLLPSLYSYQLLCLPLSSVGLRGLSFLFPTLHFIF